MFPDIQIAGIRQKTITISAAYLFTRSITVITAVSKIIVYVINWRFFVPLAGGHGRRWLPEHNRSEATGQEQAMCEYAARCVPAHPEDGRRGRRWSAGL